MTLLIALLALSVAATIGTLVVVARDGYRRIPVRRDTLPAAPERPAAPTVQAGFLSAGGRRVAPRRGVSGDLSSAT